MPPRPPRTNLRGATAATAAAAPRQLLPSSSLRRLTSCRYGQYALSSSPPSSFSSRSCHSARHTTSRRLYSSSSSSGGGDNMPPAPSGRWLSDLQARLGKCITFGCSPAQVSRAAAVLRALTEEWRGLTAGSEGFLTGSSGLSSSASSSSSSSSPLAAAAAEASEGEKGQGAPPGLDGQQVVWGEMDTFQHVNNVVYIRYAESARVNWVTRFLPGQQQYFTTTTSSSSTSMEEENNNDNNREAWRSLMRPGSRTGLIMKSIKASYKLPVTYPDRISAYHRLSRRPEEGDTSLSLDCVVLTHRHRRVACQLEEDIVVYDYVRNEKTAVPGWALGVLRGVWERQGQEMRRARGRIAELEGMVRGIEKETWDREGAVEDVGAAGGR